MSYNFDSSINEIGNLASGVYKYDFDEDSSLATPDYISGWMQNNMGELNILIHTAYEGEDPNMGDEEQAIYRQLFLKEYYKKLGRKLLTSAFGTTTETTVASEGSSFQTSDWTELREGDSVIKRQASIASPGTKVTASKQYASLSTEAELTLKDLLYKYNSGKSSPIQVAGNDAPV